MLQTGHQFCRNSNSTLAEYWHKNVAQLG